MLDIDFCILTDVPDATQNGKIFTEVFLDLLQSQTIGDAFFFQLEVGDTGQFGDERADFAFRGDVAMEGLINLFDG